MKEVESTPQKKSNVVSLQNYRAKNLVEDGKHLISKGDLDGALDTFRDSVKHFATAEALTYIAWIIGIRGDYDKAIDLCKKAIELDPSYGNPYNDIGSYLIKKNKLVAAIPWLEKAKMSKNYEQRHYPHINLGRVYALLGKNEDAILEFETALELSPNYPNIKEILAQLKA